MKRMLAVAVALATVAGTVPTIVRAQARPARAATAAAVQVYQAPT
jgi:hypothetical protein